MGPYVIQDRSLLTSLPGTDAAIPQAEAGYGVQCVGLLKYYTPEVGSTQSWREGSKVNESPNLTPGTAIATFSGGHYLSHRHGNHACYFVRFLSDGSGFTVLEQHVRPVPHLIQTRDIKYGGNHSNSSPSDDANAYSVIL